jgi:Fe-Mn family superoxide dismutase
VGDPVVRAGRQALFLQQLYTHQDNHLIGAVPLLCIDAWEHAYYLQYKNVKADYAKAIWNVIDWNDVATRYGSATSGSTVATTS